MDDRLIRKIKTISNFISFYKTFFFITSITTVLISYIMQSLFEEDKFFINNFIENWSKRPITDLKFSTEECTGDFEQSKLGQWPMSADLCDCTHSIFYSSKRSRNKSIKPYPCSLFLRIIGCRNFDEVKSININQWKGQNVCVKRQNRTYLEDLMYDSECKCNLVDSLNKKVCSNECPVNNAEINKKIFQSEKNQKNSENTKKIIPANNTNTTLSNKIKKTRNSQYNSQNISQKNSIKNSKKNSKKNYRTQNQNFLSSMLMSNFTTFSDIEENYNKNFNISLNNEMLGNFAISDIIISEHYPCLINNNIHKINQVDRLFDFVIENVDFIYSTSLMSSSWEKKEKPDSRDGNFNDYYQYNINSKRFSSKSENRINGLTQNSKNNFFNEIDLRSLDKQDCYFYENSYFDRRHYVIDILNFYQFLLSDMNEDSFKYKNLTLSYEEISGIKNFTPTTTMFLISSPFFGWNYRICRENPNDRMFDIIQLYDSAYSSMSLVVFLKLACLIYLTINGVFEKIFDEFYFGVYTKPADEPYELKSNFQIFFDMIYYFLNVLIVCGLIYICFTLKNLGYFQYLYMIRNDCLDEYSTKLLTYLYDVCEEKFIYCVFMLFINSVEFIFFTLIFKNSYELKITLK
jgi:hypothetical protein